jgi:hypothetical protein
MTFLWAVVIVMAIALVAEIAAFVGMGLVARGVAQRVAALQGDVSQRVRPTVQFCEALKVSLQPHIEVVRREGKQIGVLFASRFATLRTAYEDAHRRSQRLRLRLDSGSVPTVSQIQQDAQMIQQGVVEPIRAVASFARLAGEVRAAFWLLRKVA